MEVSTSEWMASEAIAEDPVQAAAANFAQAMPKFAPIAIITTVVEPLAATYACSQYDDAHTGGRVIAGKVDGCNTMLNAKFGRVGSTASHSAPSLEFGTSQNTASVSGAKSTDNEKTRRKSMRRAGIANETRSDVADRVTAAARVRQAHPTGSQLLWPSRRPDRQLPWLFRKPCR